MVKCLTQEHNMLVTAGFEPTTFGLRVNSFIHCATHAFRGVFIWRENKNMQIYTTYTVHVCNYGTKSKIANKKPNRICFFKFWGKEYQILCEILA